MSFFIVTVFVEEWDVFFFISFIFQAMQFVKKKLKDIVISSLTEY